MDLNSLAMKPQSKTAKTAFTAEGLRAKIAGFEALSDEQKQDLVRQAQEQVPEAGAALKPALLELAHVALGYRPTELYGLSLTNDLIDNHADCAAIILDESCAALKARDYVSTACYVMAIGQMTLREHAHGLANKIMRLGEQALASQNIRTRSFGLELMGNLLKENPQVAERIENVLDGLDWPADTDLQKDIENLRAAVIVIKARKTDRDIAAGLG